MPLRARVDILNELYRKLNRREYVRPDPLEFLYDYADPADREVVALVASSLAHGRVAQIRRSVAAALARLGPRPAQNLTDATPRRLRAAMAGFRHRFNTGDHLAALLAGARRVIARHGSLGACLAAAIRDDDETVVPALRVLVAQLGAAGNCGHLLPDPARGSACKRLHLMLRWLARRDAVDPGGWNVRPAKLVVPLDTHMHRIALALGATRRKTADARAALEVTGAFRRIAPDDPVRYDFALTRLGIRKDMDVSALLGDRAGRPTDAETNG